MQALAAAREVLYQRSRGTAGENEESGATPSVAQEQADALTLLAESALRHELDPGARRSVERCTIATRDAAFRAVV
jgi:hypothetical protein